MEYTGYADPGEIDQVLIRGEVDSGAFIVFWLHQGRELAGMNVNTWDVADTIGALMEPAPSSARTGSWTPGHRLNRYSDNPFPSTPNNGSPVPIGGISSHNG